MVRRNHLSILIVSHGALLHSSCKKIKLQNALRLFVPLFTGIQATTLKDGGEIHIYSFGDPSSHKTADASRDVEPPSTPR